MLLWLLFSMVLMIAGYAIRRGAARFEDAGIPEDLKYRITGCLGAYCYAIGTAALLRTVIPQLVHAEAYTYWLNIILVSFVITSTLVVLTKLRRLQVE